MNIIVFDSESTGLADFRSPPDAPHQPRLVQLAALLLDNHGKRLASFCAIVKPEGFTIPEEASNIHGITDDIALSHGLSIHTVHDVFREMCGRATTFVAYNAAFDKLVLEGSYMREMVDPPWEDGITLWSDPMLEATDIVKLPGKYGYKWPKLQEAHQFFFGTAFDGAHDAMADVEATAKVYFELRRRESAE